MVATVYQSLVSNGVDRERITILTYYEAQKKLITDKIKGVSNLTHYWLYFYVWQMLQL